MGQSKTSKHYAKNPKSRRKHVRDNSNGGKYDKPSSYQKEHQAQRRKLKCSKTQDVVKKKGKWTCGDRKQNRAKGGAKRKWRKTF